MTPRERAVAVLEGQMPDRLPREFKLTPPLLDDFRRRTGADDPADYYELDVRDVYFAPPSETGDPSTSLEARFSRYYPEGVPTLWNPAGWEVGEWGVGVKPGSLHHFVQRRFKVLLVVRFKEELVYFFLGRFSDCGFGIVCTQKKKQKLTRGS